MKPRRGLRPSLLLIAGLALMCVNGCRLYEPERYARLQFAPGVKPIRVLMIGNSLTYYNDLPGLLQQFSAGENSPIYVEKITSPLVSLKRHWESDDSRDRITRGGGGGPWDIVIVQEYSRLPVTDPDQSLYYFGRFADEIRRAGGRMIIFENWTRRGLDAEHAALAGAYRRIAASTRAPVAPVGEAFRAVGRSRPDIKLLIDDRHPTDAGTYLAAAVLYRAIYQKPAAALPSSIQGPRLPADVIAVLREAADRAVLSGL